MKFRIPFFIKSLSGNIILTVFIALALFAYGVYSHSKRVNLNLTEQYTKYLVIKTEWIQSNIFNNLNKVLTSNNKLEEDIPVIKFKLPETIYTLVPILKK